MSCHFYATTLDSLDIGICNNATHTIWMETIT